MMAMLVYPLAGTVLSITLFAAAARADDVPFLDTAPLCKGIANQSSLQEGFRKVSFDECMKAEQQDRDQLSKEWSQFSASDKTHCVTETTMGGESSYTELMTCLEMARDVKELDASAQQPDDTPKPPQKRRKGSH